MKLEFNNVELPDLKDIFAPGTYQRLKDSILAIMLGQKDALFEKSQSPDGVAWLPLSKKAKANRMKKRGKVRLSKAEKLKIYAANEDGAGHLDHDSLNRDLDSALKAKNENHKILIDTGALQNSMSVKGNPHSFQSTEGEEVAIGTNLPYAAAQNYGYKGIPARPFIGIGEHDQTEIDEKIIAYLNKEGA